MSNYMIAIDGNGQPYLAHHGIKGQKWGIRRYQNSDGSLTDAGKKRYYNQDGSLTKAGTRENNKRLKEYQQKWYKSYNAAASRFNSKIKEINEHHDGGQRGEKYGFDRFGNVDYHLKAGQDYIREVDSAWRSIYTDEILKHHKASLTTGYDWVSQTYGMDMYSGYLKDMKNNKESDT